jgi:type III pantothenate kinase
MVVRQSLPPVDALLALDVGNTRIGMSVWDDDGLHASRRIACDDPAQWPQALREAWAETHGAARRAVVMASVAPTVAAGLSSVIEQVCAQQPLQPGRDLPLPMALDLERPEEVGVDRVCSAAAAFDRIQAACVVASFGTAICVDCVSSEGAFLGGAILPGFEMSCAALHDRTAQLPHVQPQAPNGPFGKTTREAIVNGIVYGAVGALREIVERYATELREWPQLVITGGNAPLVKDLADFVDSVVPDLCLMGVALAYRRASGQT